MLAGRNAEAEVASHAALDVLEALPPSPELAFALRSHANIRMLNRDNAEAVEMGKRAIELAEQVGAQEAVVGALNTTGTALLLMGDESGRGFLQRSLALAEATGLEVHVANAWSNQGSVAGADTAMEVLGRPSVAAISRIMALLAVGRLRARRGDPDVWPVLDEALQLAERTQTLQRLGPVRSAG